MKRQREELYHDEFSFPPSLSICPVCGASVSKDNIDFHVQQHFTQSQTPTSTITSNYYDLEVPAFSETADYRICTYGKCQEIVSASEWDDHQFSHTLQDQGPLSLGTDQSDPSNISPSNSSLLALQLHHEFHQEDDATAAMYETDKVLAKELERQEMEALENHPCEWSDHLLAQAIESEEQRKVEEKQEKEKEEFKKLQAMYGMNSTGSYASQYSKSLERDVNRGKASVGDYYARKAEMLKILMTDNDSGESCTRGIIPRLHQRYKLGVSGTKVAWTSADIAHYASTVGDAGWGCGYRNLQMLVSCLLGLDMYRPMLYGGEGVPSITRIQQLIETAWNAGFDKQGAEQLGCKLINTRKWIGATEIAAVLRSLGIRTKLIDFHRATGCDGTHPEMFSWIKRYFSCVTPGFGGGSLALGGLESGNFRQTSKPPLYLQHQGHSRLVIGVEEHAGKEGGLYLLLFDPSHSAKQMQSLLDDIKASSSGLRHLRRSLKQMRCKQYQIVYVDGVMDAQEMERSKFMDSTRVP
ncbi:zinc finger-containing ubiquitin peptidase 1 isoform X2 [Nematostella vectensis]|uniref:zinc finger-containing ubiquitin peptidase 1 isoform X2 n=1 Tax=Nematostella vectensis TaxID=45351 RepID=UPI002077551D|nr:zinc finger-containing ubiquitin peptidase 1 isoform X2 [Nematostella vectensis]